MSIIYKNLNEVEVKNSTTETSLAVFDFEQYRKLNKVDKLFGFSEVVRTNFYGEFEDNTSGLSPQCHFRLKFLGSTLGQIVHIPVGSPKFKLSQEYIFDKYDNSFLGTQANFVGDSIATAGDNRVGVNNHSVAVADFSQLKMDLTAELSVAHNNARVILKGFTIEVI